MKDSFRSLGGILLGIKELSAKISKVIEDLERESKSIVHSAEIETDAIANISSSIEELSATASEIAGNTENLAISTEQTSASIDELVSSIKNINETTQELSIEIESTSSSIEEQENIAFTKVKTSLDYCLKYHNSPKAHFERGVFCFLEGHALDALEHVYKAINLGKDLDSLGEDAALLK